MLKKNFLLLSICLCLLAASGFAQDTSKSNLSTPWQLKVQAGYSFSRSQASNPGTGSTPSTSTQAFSKLSFPHLSIARVSPRGNFQELSVDYLNNSVNTAKNRAISNNEFADRRNVRRGIGLSYRYAFRLVDKGRFRAYAAARTSLDLNYNRSDISSPSNSSESRATNLSLGLGVEPIVQWDLNDRFFLEMTLPINLLNGSLRYARNKNSFTNDSWQSELNANYRTNNFQNISARLGLGIRL